MKQQIIEILTDVLTSLGYDGVTPEVSRPENADHGEYTTNVAMVLAQKKKLRPIDIAKKIQETIDGVVALANKEVGDLTTYQTGQTVPGFQIKPEWKKVLQAIEKIEIAGPGFLNIHFDKAKLSTLAIELLFSESSAKIRQKLTKKKIMVEFTDPNPFKELHIGHLYSNAVGESICRLYEAIGWEVKRADYFGDVGMHVAKSLWGMQKKLHDEGVTLANIEEKPLVARVHWLGEAYSMGAQAYEIDETAKEAMKTMNALVYKSAQGENIKETGISSLYETGRAWSMEYFETVFQRLGTRFDYYYPESMVGVYGEKIVREHIQDGIFVKSDGAIIFEGEKVGLHNRVFLNSLGLPTYEAKELGLNWKKHEDYPADVSLIVTGKEINEYFDVLLAAMKQVIPEVAKKTKHIGHGMVRLPSGKMSSRTGTVVTGESLIDIVKKEICIKVLDNISKDKDSYTTNTNDISEALAIAAIKYSFLRIALPGDLIFDIEKSLTLSGDSGPYLLYTYARCNSVLLKASERSKEIQGLALNEEEFSLIRQLLYFPEIVAESADLYAPNILCTYLFTLAQAFNLFYQKCPILENPYRLKLTDAVARVLKKGLYLLGIETVERM